MNWWSILDFYEFYKNWHPEWNTITKIVDAYEFFKK